MPSGPEHSEVAGSFASIIAGTANQIVSVLVPRKQKWAHDVTGFSVRPKRVSYVSILRHQCIPRVCSITKYH